MSVEFDKQINVQPTEKYIKGIVSNWLTENNFKHRPLGFDYQGVEIIEIKAENLISISLSLYAYGFNYLRSQCAYDVQPGGKLASVYHLTKIDLNNEDSFEEVCLKVFVDRSTPSIPSVYWIWKTADFQERESYDMFGIQYEGHPHLKRILMPENWIGWPLRKDYITPDFYELQDAF
jgi:NAD(P)H-quinone oxidoreductase subunit J